MSPDSDKGIIGTAFGGPEDSFYLGLEAERKTLMAEALGILIQNQIPVTDPLKLAFAIHYLRAQQVDAVPEQKPEESGYQLPLQAKELLRSKISNYETSLSNEPTLEDENNPDRGELKGLFYAMGVESSALELDNTVSGIMARTALVINAPAPVNSQGQETHAPKYFTKEAIEDNLQEVATTYGVQKDALKAAVVGLMNGEDMPADEDLQWALMHYRVPTTDPGEMLEALQTHNIEGFLVNTAQIMVELRREAGIITTDNWQKAQQLLTFYAPLLEFVGLEKLAAEAYSDAYVYLHTHKNDESIMQQGVEIIARAEEVFGKVKKLLSPKLEGLASIGGIVDFRLKTPGSLLEKLSRVGTEKNAWTDVQDIIGARVIIQNSGSQSYEDYVKKIINKVSDIFNKLRIHGFVLGDIRGVDRPVIECRSSAISADQAKEYNVRGCGKVSILPPPDSNYQGIHCAAKFHGERNKNNPTDDPREVPIEIQIYTQDEEENNRNGSNHVFYKAKIMMGTLGELLAAIKLAKRDQNVGEGEPEEKKDIKPLEKNINLVKNTILFFRNLQVKRIQEFLNDSFKGEYSLNHESAMAIMGEIITDRYRYIEYPLKEILDELTIRDLKSPSVPIRTTLESMVAGALFPEP